MAAHFNVRQEACVYVPHLAEREINIMAGALIQGSSRFV
jgi:hypothetical protein